MPHLYRRWFYAFALLSGLMGVSILIPPLAQQTVLIDLFTLLAFTVTALLVSYLKVAIWRISTGPSLVRFPGVAVFGDVELCFDGALLLGATLVGGPVLGGWAAILTGLVAPMLPFSALGPLYRIEEGAPARAEGLSVAQSQAAGATSVAQRHPPAVRRGPRYGRVLIWVDYAATALLNGGRNACAVVVAWLAYRGLGGTLAPVAVDVRLALALVVLCVVYALVRRLWVWLALVLHAMPPLLALESLVAPGPLLVELVPLPVAFLISAVYVGLGWASFLIMLLVFVGLGAVMRQMLKVLQATRERLDALLFVQRVCQAVARAPQEVDALCALAYSLCAESISPDQFEIGFYNATLTHVHIRLKVSQGATLPPMYVPLTPLWRWTSELQGPVLAESPVQLAALPFSLTPIGAPIGAPADVPVGTPVGVPTGEAEPAAALFVPLPRFSPAGGSGPGDLAVSASPNGTPIITPTIAPGGPPGTANGALPAGGEGGAPLFVSAPTGAIVLQSTHPNAFAVRDLGLAQVVAEQIGHALQRLPSFPPNHRS